MVGYRPVYILMTFNILFPQQLCVLVSYNYCYHRSMSISTSFLYLSITWLLIYWHSLATPDLTIPSDVEIIAWSPWILNCVLLLFYTKKCNEHLVSILKRQNRTFQTCTFNSTRPAVTYCVYEQDFLHLCSGSGIQRVQPWRTPWNESHLHYTVHTLSYGLRTVHATDLLW